MGTAYSELIRQTLLKLQPRADGLTRLAVEQSINDALKVLVLVKDFDELVTLDTSNAVTTANTKSYHVDTNWNLDRCKEIHSIRLMSNAESRKLVYVPPRKLDELIPYTEQVGTGKSNWYTERGKNVELYRIPDAVYSLYIQHSQWPTVLANETDECEIENLDFVIVTLAADMALASLEGGDRDWLERAKLLLGIAKTSDRKPDQMLVANQFSAAGGDYGQGEYWLNPWYRRQPSGD